MAQMTKEGLRAWRELKDSKARAENAFLRHLFGGTLRLLRDHGANKRSKKVAG